MSYQKHPNAIIVIHWLTVLLLTVSFFLPPYPDELKLNIQNVNHFPKKIILGIILLVLSLARIFIKRRYPDHRPSNIKYFRSLHKKIAKSVYYLIYVFLVFIPMVGLTIFYQLSTFSNNPEKLLPGEIEFYHTLLSVLQISIFIFVSFITIHVVYLLYYMIVKKENILKRIFF